MPRAIDGIIDAIDELVDDQLTHEPSGYDNNVNQPECPHCGREVHGLPITMRIAAMYVWGFYDETYCAAEDDTPVVCRGSDFIGPMPAECHPWAQGWVSGYGPAPCVSTQPLWTPPTTSEDRWWRSTLPEGSHLVEEFTTSETFLYWAFLITVGDQTYAAPGQKFRYSYDNDGAMVVDVLATEPPRLASHWYAITAAGTVEHPEYAEDPEPNYFSDIEAGVIHDVA